MERIIEDDEFIAAVRAVLAERGPDFVYQPEPDMGTASCMYSRDNGISGSCLYGTAVIEQLRVKYTNYWESKSVAAIFVGDGKTLWALSPAVKSAAWITQNMQDQRFPYGVVSQEFEFLLANPEIARTYDNVPLSDYLESRGLVAPEDES